MRKGGEMFIFKIIIVIFGLIVIRKKNRKYSYLKQTKKKSFIL